MFWKLLVVAEILLLLLTVWDIDRWEPWTIVLLAVTVGRAFAVFTYAFNETRYSTPQFWKAFRFVYVAWVALAVARFVTTLTAGFQYGIFPTVDAVYAVQLAVAIAALALLICTEWTVISHLTSGRTARDGSRVSTD